MFSLKDFGSFYVGGHNAIVSGQPIQKVLRNDHTIIDVDPNGEYSTGGMYVQYYKPLISNGAYLLIHGGGLSGAIWEHSEYSRKNWIKSLLALNKTVYIVDAVGTGRSGYFPFDPKLSSQRSELRSNERTWTYFRFGKAADYAVKNVYSKSKFSRDKFQNLTKQNIPRWNDYVEPSISAIKELLKIEPNWCLLAHSQGSDIAMRLLGETVVKNILLIEPAAFPNLREINNFSGKTIGFLYGDYIDIEQSPFWTSLLEKAEKYMDELAARGANVKKLSLPDIGVYGNTHVPMCDENSEEVFFQLLSLIEDDLTHL